MYNATGAITALATVLTVPAGDKRWQFLIPRREIETNPTIEQNPIKDDCAEEYKRIGTFLKHYYVFYLCLLCLCG